MARYLDNPAGRLHALLDDLQAVTISEPTWKAWAQVIAPDLPDDMPTWRVVRALVDVTGLIALADDQIDSLGDLDTELLMAWHPKAQKAMTSSLQHLFEPIQHVQQVYDNTTLAELAFCSYELHRRRPEPVPGDDQLDAVKERVKQLRDDVLRSKLDDDVRLFLHERLNALVYAIDEIRAHGSAGLERALDGMMGALTRRPDLLAGMQKDSKIWPRVKSAVAAVSLLVNTTSAVLQLPGIADAVNPSSPTTTTIVIDLHQDGDVWLTPPDPTPPAKKAAAPPAPKVTGNS